MTNLLGKKKVYVYYINKLSQLRVYLDRTQVSTCSLYSPINLTHLPISVIYQSHSSANLTNLLSTWNTCNCFSLSKLTWSRAARFFSSM